MSHDLVSRQTGPAERRCVVLAPTERGRTLVRAAYEATQSKLAVRLADLRAAELAGVIEALNALGAVFASSREIETNPEK